MIWYEMLTKSNCYKSQFTKRVFINSITIDFWFLIIERMEIGEEGSINLKIE